VPLQIMEDGVGVHLDYLIKDGDRGSRQNWPIQPVFSDTKMENTTGRPDRRISPSLLDAGGRWSFASDQTESGRMGWLA